MGDQDFWGGASGRRGNGDVFKDEVHLNFPPFTNMSIL